MRAARHFVGSLLASMAILSPVTELSAQSIRGQIVDSLSGAAVPRGFVVLLNDAGIEVERKLTASDGGFLFAVGAAGLYRVRSERIGYAVTESPLLDLAVNQELDITLLIGVIAHPLATIEVRGETQCGDPTEDENFSALWIEARKALEATTWTNEQAYRHTLHRYRRVRETRRHRIEYERTWQVEGYAIHPFASISAQRLALHGYVVPTGRSRFYYGPDANVLLDDSFHSNHCFAAVAGEGELSGNIGLAFRPHPDNKKPDITGVLWIDIESSELNRIEYRYTNVELLVQDERIGGSIQFNPLSSGAWVLNEWQVRTPVIEYRPQIDSQGRVRSFPALTGIVEEGGAVIEVADELGSIVYTAPDVVHMTGTVRDGPTGRPLENELVSIVGTGYSTFTDSDGRFILKTLLRGPRALTSGTLDSVGYTPGRAHGYLAPRDTLSLDLTIPAGHEIQHHLCPKHGIPATQRAIVGVVRDSATGQAIDGIEVLVSWRPERHPEANPIGTDRIAADSTGSFVFCGLPTYRTLRVEIDSDHYQVEPAELTFRGDSVVMGDRGAHQGTPAPYRIWKVDLTASRVERN